jgi:hypothetical protein
MFLKNILLPPSPHAKPKVLCDCPFAFDQNVLKSYSYGERNGFRQFSERLN